MGLFKKFEKYLIRENLTREELLDFLRKSAQEVYVMGGIDLNDKTLVEKFSICYCPNGCVAFLFDKSSPPPNCPICSSKVNLL